MRKHNTLRGFTLIELLVVIAIIGLLSSIVLASLNQAKNKGVNGRIQADIHQWHNALELYYSKHGFYPPVTANNTWYCLGSYPPTGCYNSSNVSQSDPVLNGAISETFPGLPQGQATNSDNGNTYLGYIYECKNGSNGAAGQCTSLQIRWTVNGGNQSCTEQGQSTGNFGTNVTGCKLDLP